MATISGEHWAAVSERDRGFTVSGIGQLSAGLWSLRARDAAGASLFCIWGGFWIGYGLRWLLDALGTFSLPSFGAGFQPLGQVFIYLGCLGGYVASMFMLRSAWRRVILPFGTFKREGNIPGQQIEFPSEHVTGQPGVRQGAP